MRGDLAGEKMILLKLFLVFLKIGLFTVGSGYSMLVLAQQYVVDNYHWLTIEEFNDVVSLGEVTPGPIIVNLATFVGTRVAGWKGAVFATAGLVAIPFIGIYLLCLNYDKIRMHHTGQAVLKVIRPMAVGFITVAVIRLSMGALTDITSAIIAGTVIAAVLVFKINPIIIVLAGLMFAVLVR